MEQFGCIAYSLAQTIADILAEKMGQRSTFFQENCKPTTSYLRLNRYPPNPIPMASKVHGLVPHTDSDFLTILHQDHVRGLQLLKDGKWVAVKPNPDALIISIGDLFQAWSSGVYKSVEHRVVTNPKMERFSVVYFFCPFDDTIIESCGELSIYRKFSYRGGNTGSKFMMMFTSWALKLDYPIFSFIKQSPTSPRLGCTLSPKAFLAYNLGLKEAQNHFNNIILGFDPEAHKSQIFYA